MSPSNHDGGDALVGRILSTGVTVLPGARESSHSHPRGSHYAVQPRSRAPQGAAATAPWSGAPPPLLRRRNRYRPAVIHNRRTPPLHREADRTPHHGFPSHRFRHPRTTALHRRSLPTLLLDTGAAARAAELFPVTSCSCHQRMLPLQAAPPLPFLGPYGRGRPPRRPLPEHYRPSMPASLLSPLPPPAPLHVSPWPFPQRATQHLLTDDPLPLVPACAPNRMAASSPPAHGGPGSIVRELSRPLQQDGRAPATMACGVVTKRAVGGEIKRARPHRNPPADHPAAPDESMLCKPG